MPDVRNVARRKKARHAPSMTTPVRYRFAVRFALGLLLAAAIVAALRRTDGRPPSLLARNADIFDYDLEWNRTLPSLVLWFVFFLYWAIASHDSAESETSESSLSTHFHQIALGVSLVLLLWPVPGLDRWFLPQRLHVLVAVGAAIQIAFASLAVWARRHLGRNWSAEVRIGQGHQLVRTGPYRLLRHPIYTAMLGMFLGTAIAGSQYHALVAIVLLFFAYLRKTRLEEEILARTFGAEWDAYRRSTWALVPGVY